MRLLLLLLITTLTIQVSHSQDFTVRGFLINNSDGEPIPFEKIKLLNIDSTTVSGAITDVNSFYQISKLKQRNYLICVRLVQMRKQGSLLRLNSL